MEHHIEGGVNSAAKHIAPNGGPGGPLVLHLRKTHCEGVPQKQRVGQLMGDGKIITSVHGGFRHLWHSEFHRMLHQNWIMIRLVGGDWKVWVI